MEDDNDNCVLKCNAISKKKLNHLDYNVVGNFRSSLDSIDSDYDKALADEFNGWVLHHRLECTIDGEFAHSAEELKRMGMYYNRPYYELIYLTRSEHSKLHYRSGHSLSNKRSRRK